MHACRFDDFMVTEGECTPPSDAASNMVPFLQLVATSWRAIHVSVLVVMAAAALRNCVPSYLLLFAASSRRMWRVCMCGMHSLCCVRSSFSACVASTVFVALVALFLLHHVVSGDSVLVLLHQELL